MDRKKLPKDCNILYFYIVYSEIMSRISYNNKGLQFQRGFMRGNLRLRTPWGYNVLGKGFCVSIVFVVMLIGHLLDGVILLLRLEFFTFFLSNLILVIQASFKQQKH